MALDEVSKQRRHPDVKRPVTGHEVPGDENERELGSEHRGEAGSWKGNPRVQNAWLPSR